MLKSITKKNITNNLFVDFVCIFYKKYYLKLLIVKVQCILTYNLILIHKSFDPRHLFIHTLKTLDNQLFL